MTFDANNRINNGIETYDAAGNMLTDGFHTYTYDAENRIICVDNGAAVYQYDAEGRRVRKITGASSCGATTGGMIVDYLYDLAGRPVTKWCAKCSWGSGWDEGDVWAAGMHLATYSEGTLFFNHSDWLGTERARTGNNGASCETITSLPFGDGMAYSGSCGDPSVHHFTGKERDTESNLDYFGARYFSSSMGRFVTPDWASDPTAVPYAFYANPQSLNLYNYMRNNPLSGVDPDGHCCDIWDVINFVGGFLNAYGSDNLVGAGRVQQDTSAGQSGATAGDAVATVQGGLEVLGGAGGEVGGVTLDATGVGALIGVPVNVASAGLIVHGAATAGTGASNLLKDAVNAPMQSRAGDFTAGEKQQMDQENASRNGGQNRCTECGQDVQKVGNKAGQSAPGNQLQRHHDPPLSQGGNSQSPNNRIVCRDCHIKIHQKPVQQ